MRWGWAWIAGVLLGRGLYDSTDSRPLNSNTSAPQDHPNKSQKEGIDEVDYKAYGVERGRQFPRDVRYSVEMEYSQPLGGWIARKADGRFVLDNGSDEGGFTSPRRPTRRIHPMGHGAEKGLVTPVWIATEGAGVQSGVYHVRAGTTSRLDHRQPLPPRLSLRSDGSGASTNEEFRSIGYRTSGPRGTLLSYNMPTLSPEFGHHQIPTSPQNIAPSPSKRFRSSSPGPLSNEWNQLAQLASFSEDLSSVQQPSSVERSFPSTVLSSWPNSNQNTPSAHGASGILSPPYDDLGDLHQRYANQLPPLHQYANLRSRRFHLVGAEVHSPPAHLQSTVSHTWSPSASLNHPWVTPRRHARVWPTIREGSNSHHPVPGRLELAVLGSGQHVHSPSVHHSHFPGQGIIRETLGHIQPPRIPDIPLHYVNLPPRSGDPYQRIPGQDPPYLLKPSSSENQKPLATSSPPRPRAAHTRQPQSMQGPLKQLPHQTMPSTNTAVPDPLVRPMGKNRDTDLSSDHQPQEYTRDRLNETIGQLRSDLNRTSSSAPELSSVGKSEVRHASRRLVRPAVSAPVSQEQSHEQSQEISHEQSPDSSSGFGSKNTSQQQSSSQSGQSLSATGLNISGLDASRIESSEAPEIFGSSGTAVPSHWIEVKPQVRRAPFVRPPQPPPYEVWEARQVLPQFRMPGQVGMRPPGVVMGAVNRWNRLTTTPLDASIDSSGPTLTSSKTIIPKISIVNTPSTPSKPLDNSVDDHYEFDTVLSPVPGDDIAAEWSRSRVPSGERGLSDSEIYSSGERRRHESMETRVAAMKQEFNEYRIKQAHRRRRSRELESVC